MPKYHPDSSDHSGRNAAGRREKTRRDVVCKICQAVYVPSQTHMQLARSPQAVIESTFMGMCHFCFRCRQPACPSCWDEVHGVCGACALEAKLPFRSGVPPLDGVTIPPIHHVPLVRVRTVTPPLVCVRPGRFQRAPLPIEAQTTLFVPTISDQPLSDSGKRHPSPKTPLPSSKHPSRVTENIADVATRPGNRPTHTKDTTLKATIRRNKLGYAVTVVLLLIALLMIILIVSALFFTSVNDSTAYILHVDIRAKIAYLLELIQHLF